MNRALFSGSLVCVTFLLIGTFMFPSSMVMELASTSALATVFRVLMAAMLITVLLSSPPRRLLVRAAMGGIALVLLVSGVVLSLTNSMHLLDVLLFFELGCALGIEALEFNDDEVEQKTERFHEMYHTTQTNQLVAG